MRDALVALFAASLVIANVLAAKLVAVPLGVTNVAVPAGFVAFGLAFLCSDLLVEFYGEDVAARVLYRTVGALLVVYALIWLALAMPAAPFVDDTAFAQTLSSSAAVTVASVVTILFSQRLDVWLFAHLRARTGAGHRWLRNCGSTATSQLLDTVVFITLAFAVVPTLQGGTPLWGGALVATIAGQYVAKLAIVALDTPIFYAVTGVIR